MVEVTNALQPLPQRQLRIVPLDLVKEISATASVLRGRLKTTTKEILKHFQWRIGLFQFRDVR